MSEFDSGSGRKGFVHDVMRRISSSAPRAGDSPEIPLGTGEPDRLSALAHGAGVVLPALVAERRSRHEGTIT